MRQLAPTVAPSRCENGAMIGPGADNDVAQHAIGSHLHAVGQRDFAFEHAAYVDAHIAATGKRAADVDARRIGDHRSAQHQRIGIPRLQDTFDCRQLRAIVDAAHIALIGDGGGRHRYSIRHRQRDDVRQVILVLRVVGLERGHPAAQQCRGRRHHAGVDLVDRALGRVRVLFFHDRAHPPRAIADDPSQSRWIGHMRGEHHKLARFGFLDQRSKRGGRHEGDVADGHQRHAVGRQRVQRDASSVAGALGRVLRRETQVRRGDGRLHGFGAMADHDHDRARRERARGGQDMRDQWTAGQQVQHFRQSRMHALALPGGEDRDVERGGHGDRDDTPPAARTCGSPISVVAIVIVAEIAATRVRRQVI